MNLTLAALMIALALFLGVMLCMEIGRRAGVSRLARDPDGEPKGIGASEGAIFGLLGLMIAFTFSGAASRFEDRRHLITEETNNIGTAWLRIELLPRDAQPEMRALFRSYLDARMAIYQHVRDEAARNVKIAESVGLQEKIWTRAVNESQKPGAAGSAQMLLLPALNAMIDVTTTRAVATTNHPPLAIFLLLPVLILIAAMLVGFDMSANKERQWLHTVAFAAVMSFTVYVIIDLEFPRLGLIRIDASDQLLVDLRKSMQ